jgi:hypothetical protein
MAATRSKQPRDYPFVFLRHGPWGYPDEIEFVQVLLVFAADVPTEQRARIEASAPDPVGSFRWPLASLMTFGPATAEHFSAQVLQAFRARDAADSRAYVRRFCDALDVWLIAAHALAPLTTVLGWFGEARDDPWAQWSARVALERALPRLVGLQRDARARGDTALGRELARRTLEVVAARCEGQAFAEIPSAEQALVRDTLTSMLGIDERADHDARCLHRRLTGEELPRAPPG